MADFLVFIVSRTAPKTYTHIKRAFGDEERDVRVIVDRRERERRGSQTPPETDRRHVERRRRDVTGELESTGWAVARYARDPMIPDATRCVAPGCQEEGVVGLIGAWLCLGHFEIRFAAMKAASDRASSSRFGT